MQVLEWAVRYPDAVAGVIPAATTARLGAQAIAFDAVGRQAILADPNFASGQYHTGPGPDSGLAIARMVGPHITYLSEQGMHAKFGRELRHRTNYSYDLESSDFSVETYLDHQGQAFVDPLRRQQLPVHYQGDRTTTICRPDMSRSRTPSGTSRPVSW